MANREVQDLVAENARLAGHQNHKQKIRYVQNLKEQVISLKKENAELEADLGRAKGAI